MATPRHMTFTLSDPRFNGISPAQRASIGNDIVSTIQSRTATGKDKDGLDFTSYNPNYVNSKHFKAAGKSSTVNLVFNDEMMQSLQYIPELSQGPNITVGFPNGSEMNRRAQYVIEGHGRKGDFTQPRRNPLGLTTTERERIIGSVPRAGVGTGIFLALSAAFLESIDDD